MIGKGEYNQELAHLPALTTTSIQDNQLQQQRVHELEEHNKDPNLSKQVQELVKALEELTKLGDRFLSKCRYWGELRSPYEVPRPQPSTG